MKFYDCRGTLFPKLSRKYRLAVSCLVSIAEKLAYVQLNLYLKALKNKATEKGKNCCYIAISIAKI